MTLNHSPNLNTAADQGPSTPASHSPASTDSNTTSHVPGNSPGPPVATPLWAVLAVTAAGSLGTSVATAGIFFITKHLYGFGTTANFAIGLAYGLVYIPAAISIAPLLRNITTKTKLTTRNVIAIIFAAMAAACIFVPIAHTLGFGHIAAMIFMGCYGLLSGLLWPIIESYVAGGRFGAPLRNATGRFNITWSVSLIIALVAMAPLFLAENSDTEAKPPAWPLLALVIMGGIHLASIYLLRWFTPNPAYHGSAAVANVPENYRPLLTAFRWQLPVSFMVVATLEPYLPFAMARIGLAPHIATAAAATWMVTRAATFILMERWHGWHGRWSTSFIGGFLMLAGFGISVTANTPALMIAGLATFGVGIGIVYTAALYYAMSVGNSGVDAGGKHEAIIGIGYAIGPICGLSAAALANTNTIQPQHESIALTASVSALAALGCIIAWSAVLRRKKPPSVRKPR